MSDKTSDKYRITLTENQLALVGTDVEGMMNDLISRQAAIAHAVPLNLFGREVMMVSVSELENLPSAQPEQTDCEYCHEDSDGYVRPLEKNCHAFVRYGINGWEISLKAKGWSGSAKIKYCPMCGRELKHG